MRSEGRGNTTQNALRENKSYVLKHLGHTYSLENTGISFTRSVFLVSL